MAPELFRDYYEVDDSGYTSQVFSLGLVVLELITLQDVEGLN